MGIMKEKGFTAPTVIGLIILSLGVVIYFGFFKKSEAVPIQSTDISYTGEESPGFVETPPCTSYKENDPILHGINPGYGSVGTKIEMIGCNLAGFEGDKNIWIENGKGEKAVIYGDAGSTSELIRFTISSPLCQEDTSYSGKPCARWLTLVPGQYTLYASPWGKESNKLLITVT